MNVVHSLFDPGGETLQCTVDCGVEFCVVHRGTRFNGLDTRAHFMIVGYCLPGVDCVD
jgi:hypothetical protein